MTHQVLSVGQSKDKALLTKSQKEFNRLTKKIAQMQADVKGFEEAVGKVQQRVAQDLAPLLRQHEERRADMVRLLDRAYESGKWGARERKKLEHIILDMCQELISEEGMDDLKAIYNKYSGSDFDEDDAEAEEATASLMREMMQQMFGIEIPEDADVSTPEKMQAYLMERMEQEEASEEERKQKAAERRAQKPKTAKQIEREQKKAEKDQKKAEEEAKTTKSVREVYLDLVKAFHPDREPDEAERLRKTEIMQRVTDAYERNDLLALLQLQLEFERIDQEHLETMAEEKLLHFNKLLRKQASELDELLWGIKQSLSQMTNRQPYLITTPFVLEYWLDGDIKKVKKEMRGLEKDLQELADPQVLKAWLKGYKIQKPKADDFFDLFG